MIAEEAENTLKLLIAGVVKWQTRRTQNPVRATLCGFDSHHRHHLKVPSYMKHF
jgi:hypothetical protein